MHKGVRACTSKMNVFVAEFGSEGSPERTLLGVFSSLQRVIAAWNARPDHGEFTLYVTQAVLDGS